MNDSPTRWTGPVLAAIVLAGSAATAPAQNNLERFDRQLEQIQRQTRLLIDREVPAVQRARFDYGGFVSFGFFAIDDPNARTHILRQPELNLFTSINLDGAHEFYARGSMLFRDFNTGESFDGDDDDFVKPRLDRGYYRFNLRRAMEAYRGQTTKFNLIIKAGRQLVHWANGVTLSQEIDGGLVTLEFDPVTLTALAGRSRGRFADIDSSRPGFNADMNRNFFGGMLSFQLGPRHRPFIYGLVQQDQNDNVVLTSFDSFGTAFPTRFNYDSHYIGAGSTGSFGDNWLYGLEFVYEGGTGLSNTFTRTASGAALATPQTQEDIRAYALDLRLDYLLQDVHRSRLSAEVLLASGDDDRETTTNTLGGNRPGTDDRAFNAFGLLNTGLAFSPEVSNLLMFRFGGSTFPLRGSSKLFERLQVGMDFFIFNKLEHDAPIDEPTRNDTYLGLEPDVFANWQITSDVALIVRYGVFFPSSAFGGERAARHFVYTGITYAF